MKEMKQMAPFSAQNAGSLRVIVPVVILAIGGLLLLGGQSPTKTPPTSAPTSTATILDNSYHGLPNPMTQPEATSIAVKRLAVRTHGDYDKLTYDEKMFLEGCAGSDARTALLNIARFEEKRQRTAAHRARGQQARDVRRTH